MKKLVILLLVTLSASLNAASPPPKLIIQLVIDQLRGDLLYQYQKKFNPNGFNYLLAHSINYKNAQHPHAHTVTCVGHATIATGSYPEFHGIIDNDWYNAKSNKIEYCTEDLKSKILPTARYKHTIPGRSPEKLIVSTFSDELVLANKGRAFGVSLKDRAAITLAGHAGKAFWFDKENGGFVTSQYYYMTYPNWVIAWNNQYNPTNQTWMLMDKPVNYLYQNSPLVVHRFPTFKHQFPHSLGEPTVDTYYKFLSMTPYADELTADFALKLLKAEKLGKDAKQTDYLAVSFSAVDAIGHQFGPNSLESEDNLRRLDQTLTKFLQVIDKEVGLKNTLIILTADHGVMDSPSYVDSKARFHQHPFNLIQLKKVIEHHLDKTFGLPPEAVQAIALPYIYLNHHLIHEHQLSVRRVTRYLAYVLRKQTGIYQAYPFYSIKNERDWLSQKVAHMAFPHRSGDIYVVSYPYVNFAADTAQRIDHGSPWNYDSYVPLLFVNPSFKPKVITRPVNTTDIAVTLSNLLWIKPPSASVGIPLTEVLKTYSPPS